MGGMNCNCNPKWAVGSTDRKVIDNYVDRLAVYCENLFNGVAKFFEANAAIEKSVRNQDHTFESANSFLDESIRRLEAAKLSLGGFASLDQKIDVNDFEPNFAVQLENITQAISDINLSKKMLQKASQVDFENPQEALWRTKNLTQTFASALDSVQQATYWQSDFAIRIRRALVIAV